MKRKTIMMRNTLHLLLLLMFKILMPGGCAHAADGSSAAAKLPINQVVHPDPDFDYSSERDVWIEVSVNDIEGAPAGRRTVEILEAVGGQDGGFRIIERGLTDDWGNFDRKVRVPGVVKNLLIRVGVIGIDNSVLLPVDRSLTLHHEFG